MIGMNFGHFLIKKVNFTLFQFFNIGYLSSILTFLMKKNSNI